MLFNGGGDQRRENQTSGADFKHWKTPVRRRTSPSVKPLGAADSFDMAIDVQWIVDSKIVARAESLRVYE